MTATNAFGRQVIDYLTNKSGGGVIAGDVVVIDTTNDQAFTTTTSAGFTGGIGVAQETIANNAAGRVLRYGYASLVNVNASVTRGQYGKTHTVAKQATGSATRTTGTFCQFLTGGTTPTATMFAVDLLGTSLSNPMTTTGDTIYSSDNSGTPTRRGIGSTSQAYIVAGGLPTWAYPPGYEFDRVTITAGVTVSATADSSATTCITANAVVYDGSTTIDIEVYTPFLTTAATNGAAIIVQLNEGATILAYIMRQMTVANVAMSSGGQIARFRVTPTSASHTYSVRAWRATGNGTFGAGASGSDYGPAYIRQVKV